MKAVLMDWLTISKDAMQKDEDRDKSQYYNHTQEQVLLLAGKKHL